MVDIISHVESYSVVYLIKYSLIQYDLKLYIIFTPIHDINILLACDFILLLYNFVVQDILVVALILPKLWNICYGILASLLTLASVDCNIVSLHPSDPEVFLTSFFPIFSCW